MKLFNANKSQITNNAIYTFLLNIAEQLLLAFSYSLAEKISYSAELSMEKVYQMWKNVVSDLDLHCFPNDPTSGLLTPWSSGHFITNKHHLTMKYEDRR